MKAIVAVDKNWGIGKDGQLLKRLSGDMKYFKEKTLGQTVIMGRKTLESLPGGKPLPDRETVILTSDRNFKVPGVASFNCLSDLCVGMQFCENDEAYVCGGASIYEQLMPYCSSFLVTKIFDEYPADKYFPNLDEDDDYELVWESPVYEEDGTEYQFTEYRRKRGAGR